VATTHDATQHTLAAVVPLTGTTGTGSFDTFGSVATFGKPDPATVDLSGGSLNFSVPIDLPPGEGGLTPPLTLAYSSASVAEQHNQQAPASWVGEGWNLGLGSISWAEHNVTANCASTCGNNWEDSWQLSDPFGTGGELIPPNNGVATYYDDNPNNTYFDGTNYSNMPAQWHTANESHAKIYSYVGPNSLSGMAAKPPCFRVWLPNGLMEEFGCTADSLQWYPTSSGDRIANWFLDLITDPEGNQIHITYASDMAPGYPRATEPLYIEYDSPNCRSAQTACTGSAWAPLVRIAFNFSNHVEYPGNTPSGCNTSDANVRCDDPQNLTSSGGDPAPQVMDTFALNDIRVYTRSSTSVAWGNAPLQKDYQFTYYVTGPTTYSNPSDDKNQSAAGEFALTKLQVYGDDGATKLPPRTFIYGVYYQYYEDSNLTTPTDIGCGWSWNVGKGSGRCPLWDVNRYGNNLFLTEADNGLGLSTTYTWQQANNNTHGVTSGRNALSPFACADHLNYPCDLADDENWSRIVLTQQTSSLKVPTSSNPSPTSPTQSTTAYAYTLTPLVAPECSDCQQGMYWGNQNDGDWQDFYNTHFMGFGEADVTAPNLAVTKHHFYSTMGYGVFDSNQATTNCHSSNGCPVAPWWDPRNALHGHETETDEYDSSGTTLLKQSKATFNAQCPPSGVAATPTYQGVSWDGQLVSELDHNNPVAVCDLQTTSTTSNVEDGSSGPYTSSTTSTTYDPYGRVATTTTTSNGGSPYQVAHHYGYTQNDAVSASEYGASGTYLMDFPAFSDTEDLGSPVTRTACEYTNYDGAANYLGQTSALTYGLVTRHDAYTSCGTSPNYAPGGQDAATTTTYGLWGQVLASTDADALAGDATHTHCTTTASVLVGGSASPYSSCATYDGTYGLLPATNTNALSQSTSSAYSQGSATGNGWWPTSATDANGQATSASYDPLGRITALTLPGEGSGLTTRTASYTVWCAATGAQGPCVEIDTTQRLNSSTTLTTRTFYDGLGRKVETRTSAPGGQDVVQYWFYDPTTGAVGFASVPYFVAAYTGGPGAAAYSLPDDSIKSSQQGTSYSYDALGRVTKTVNALSQATLTSYNVVSLTLGVHGNNTYEQTTVTDANGHQSATLMDAWGRAGIIQTYTGNSPATYQMYQQVQYWYGYTTDHAAQIILPDGTSQIAFAYDGLGRQISLTDPDRGHETYSYDADGNVTQMVDARGASGTTYAGYDALDRQTWRNTTNSSTGAYVTYGYDDTTNGNLGIGRLTSETFSGGPNNVWSGSYHTNYDGRGQPTTTTETINGTTYATSATYDDVGRRLTQTYPDGEVVSTSYTAQGWLAGLTTAFPSGMNGGATITLVNNLAYSGTAGALGLPTSLGLNGQSGGTSTYTIANTFDALGRPTDTKATRASDSALLYEDARGYDAAGNVVSMNTTLPTGADNQVFCYDDLNRLTWAGSTGTPACGGSLTAGTLTSAQFTAAYSYDPLDRLTTSPLGTYSYGDSNHLHGATAVGNGSTPTYTASYDASGNMTCRAPTSTTTCATLPTGSNLSYDNEGRLVHWQNAPTSPTSTDDALYDGEGRRVLQQSTVSGTTTTTTYLGSLEELSTRGSTTTTTVYYRIGGSQVALSVNGVVSYLLGDGLGSATVALDGNGNVTASQLYGPYGQLRYSSGTMPGSLNFTGQHDDTNTLGLDYYGSRYYDPVIGQFASADTLLAGINRYGYAGGNPETWTDPSGHLTPEEFITLCGIALQLISNAGGHIIARAATGASEVTGGTPTELVQNVAELLVPTGDDSGWDIWGGARTAEETRGTVEFIIRFILSSIIRDNGDNPTPPSGGGAARLPRGFGQPIDYPPRGTVNMPGKNQKPGFQTTASPSANAEANSASSTDWMDTSAYQEWAAQFSAFWVQWRMQIAAQQRFDAKQRLLRDPADPPRREEYVGLVQCHTEVCGVGTPGEQDNGNNDSPVIPPIPIIGPVIEAVAAVAA
jgi:RHS repeat-associated protein